MIKQYLRKIPGYNTAKAIYYCLERVRRHLRNLTAPSAIILLYHSIALPAQDLHRLAVSPENFRAQMKYLKENHNIISLATLVSQIKMGQLKNNSVVITFKLS